MTLRAPPGCAAHAVSPRAAQDREPDQPCDRLLLSCIGVDPAVDNADDAARALHHPGIVGGEQERSAAIAVEVLHDSIFSWGVDW